MMNFEEEILTHLKIVLREIHWYEIDLKEMPYKFVRFENEQRYQHASWDWHDYYYDDDDYDYYYNGYDYANPEDFHLGEYWGPPLDRSYHRKSHGKFFYRKLQYAFKCRTDPEEDWDLYVLTHFINHCRIWGKMYESGWHLHKCGTDCSDKVFLSRDYYDLTPETVFKAIQEILVLSVMEYV